MEIRILLYEREVIKLRTITGKKKLAKAGKYAGGSQPLGYRWNDKKKEWEIVEDEAKLQEKQKRLATVYVDGALSHEEYKR